MHRRVSPSVDHGTAFVPRHEVSRLRSSPSAECDAAYRTGSRMHCAEPASPGVARSTYPVGRDSGFPDGVGLSRVDMSADIVLAMEVRLIVTPQRRDSSSDASSAR